jgi:hypothetical protein
MVESREYTREQIIEHLNTIKMVIELFDEFPEKSIEDFKEIFKAIIKRNEIVCH